MQVRRTTRLTRTTAVLKDKENATRTTRLRAKPPSTANATENLKQPAPVKASASTAASRAKASAIPSRVDPAQGKRKREALGEVPRPPANIAKPVDVGGLKGKDKGKEKFDGVVLKTTTTTTTTTTTIRKPLQHVGGAVRPTPTAARPPATGTGTRRSTRSTTAAPARTRQQQLEQVQEEPEPERLPSQDDAMAIDPPMIPVPAPKRFVAARAAAQTGHPPLAVNRANGTTAQRRAAPRHVPKREIDEAEAGRVYKKRRTSSVEPPTEDARAEAEVERAVRLSTDEAQPDGDQWQDLDAEDADDPLMVSEYVIEIFDYLKGVEVCTFISAPSSILTSG